jgi:predicted AAA+ superfamily ATPase
MWSRLAQDRLVSLAGQFPGVLVLGARQVGKTTLARATFPDLPYSDLEEPGTRARFEEDPVFQIEHRAQPGLILDEAQSVPGIFPALRGIIDRDRSRNGRFVLLGSAQPSLVRQVSESLAGRMGILDLDPLTALEAGTGPLALPPERVWLHGGFPDALRYSFREWWEAYLRTYVERDLPHLGLSADPLVLRRLLGMLAHSQGGILNLSQLGGALSVSYHTVRRYVDILERTFLVRRLPPFFKNVGKRLTRSPKLYLRDTGLLHHLLNIGSADDLDRHPVRGTSWETFVMEDLIRRERLRSPSSQFYFWRTAAGAEIDLVLDRGSTLHAIEIKTGGTGRVRGTKRIEQSSDDIGAERAWVIDQAAGVEALSSRVERRGFSASLEWLPGD